MKLLVVPAGTGARWVREGLQAFRRAPMAFFSLFMLFMAAVALLMLVPWLGGLLGAALVPASTLALMVAARQASDRAITQAPPARPLNPADPQARPLSVRIYTAALGALRERIQALAMLGVLYVVALLAVNLLSTALVGNPMANAFDPATRAPRPEVIRSGAFMGGMALHLLMYVPVALAFWHAPALVHWHAVPPVKSLFFSLVTCLRNFGAMVVFGLVWLGVMMAISLLLSVIAGLLVGLVGSLAVSVMVGGSFIIMAMFLASTWFSFRDCFQAD